MDTLTALQTVSRHACLKLQCLSLRIMAETGRAHRALDDCVSLRQVMAAAALVLDMSVSALLGRFAQELDLPSSRAQLSLLMESGMEQEKGLALACALRPQLKPLSPRHLLPTAAATRTTTAIYRLELGNGPKGHVQS